MIESRYVSGDSHSPHWIRIFPKILIAIWLQSTLVSKGKLCYSGAHHLAYPKSYGRSASLLYESGIPCAEVSAGLVMLVSFTTCVVPSGWALLGCSEISLLTALRRDTSMCMCHRDSRWLFSKLELGPSFSCVFKSINNLLLQSLAHTI